MRTFIAVEIPEKPRRLVWDSLAEFRGKNLPIKWVEFENLHITLKFIGEIEEKRLDEIIPVLSSTSKKMKRFHCRLENVGCFPGIRNPRVIWVGVSDGGEELIRLSGELENNLFKYGIKKEDKKFHPHLTVGRIKSPCKIDELINKTIKTEPFLISEFVLFKSTLLPSGPQYEKLKTFGLI